MKTNGVAGTIHIGRINSSTDDDYMVIEVEDGTSGVQFLEVNISLVAFMDALTGHRVVPCTFELRSLDCVGKIYEHKTVAVPMPHLVKEKDIPKYLKPYEKGGWVGRVSDGKNPHNWTKTANGAEATNIHFSRFVDPTCSKS